MKTRKSKSLMAWMGTLALVLASLAGLAGCNKTIETTGILRVTSRPTSSAEFRIYENMTDSTPILNISVTSTESEFRLNMGNYYIGSTEFNKHGFQIQAGKTTTVMYDDRGVVTSVSLPNR